jgi:hypothetical protein
MTHREEVIPPYRRAVVDPLGEPLLPYRGRVIPSYETVPLVMEKGDLSNGEG